MPPHPTAWAVGRLIPLAAGLAVGTAATLSQGFDETIIIESSAQGKPDHATRRQEGMASTERGTGRSQVKCFEGPLIGYGPAAPAIRDPISML